MRAPLTPPLRAPPPPPPRADWDASAEDPTVEQLWEEDWDDADVSDDFAQRLKEELAKMNAADAAAAGQQQ